MSCYLFLVRVRFYYLVEVVEHIVVGSGSVTDNKVRRNSSVIWSAVSHTVSLESRTSIFVSPRCV